MKNIVYIFCDELRQDALGCYSGDRHTPHIDSIAARGTLFENCYCNSPVCVPSRASILTGLYPEETGIYHNEAMQPAFRIPVQAITLPQVLSQADYATASFGKTHVPRELDHFGLNVRQGGEMNLGLAQSEIQGLKKIRPRRGMPMNIASLYPEGRAYYPEKVTENALAWMREQRGPFFVRISYLQPHTPIILKRGYEDLCREFPGSDALADISGLSAFEQAFAQCVGLDSLTPEEIRTARAYYYAMVRWVDDQVGLILKELQQMDLLRDTILVFGADHGALRGECRGLGKHIFQRASQAVPLIIADPDSPREGRRVSQPVSNIDLARTLLEMVGAAVPAQFHGENIMAGHYPAEIYATIGYGENDSFAFPNRQHGRMPDGRGWPRRSCIRTQHYRLDLSTRADGRYTGPENEDLFFVDTRVCPAEDRNMADLPEYAQTVRSLREKLLAHTAGAIEVPPEMIRMPEKGIGQPE